MEPEILIQGGSANETRLALEIAEIAGVQASTGPVKHPALVVVFGVGSGASSGARTGDSAVPPGVPSVKVGPGLELELPKDATLLAQVMIEAAKEKGEKTRQLAIVVAGFHGGAGTTRCAENLGRIGQVPVFDASGHPHGRSRTPLTWNDVDPNDPPTLGQYRPGGGEPVISSARGRPVGVDDPRVRAVVARSRGTVVIDAGTWMQAINELPNATIILIGKSRQVDKLFEIIQDGNSVVRAIITDKSNAPEMLNVAHISGATVFRYREMKRIWRKLCA